jgi:ribosomal protein S6--L-glutamate ligase
MFDVAIIGGVQEPEVKRLAGCLEALGHPPLILDATAFPRQHHLTFVDGGWQYDGHDLGSTKAFFLRSLHCHQLVEGTAQGLVCLREKDSFLGSLLKGAAWQGKMVLNPVETLFCHFYKLDTFARLQQAKLPIPATLGTNDPKAVKEFAARHEHLICKPLAGGAVAVAISAEDLSPESLAQLQNAPVMLQERVLGEDIRAYVLGDQVIAAASLTTEHADFRTGPQNFRPTTLTPAEATDVVLAAKLMSLHFAGIDFKRTRKRRHFLLDINPAPMFAGFEAVTGQEIANHIAGYLIGKVTSKITRHH